MFLSCFVWLLYIHVHFSFTTVLATVYKENIIKNSFHMAQYALSLFSRLIQT